MRSLPRADVAHHGYDRRVIAVPFPTPVQHNGIEHGIEQHGNGQDSGILEIGCHVCALFPAAGQGSHDLGREGQINGGDYRADAHRQDQTLAELLFRLVLIPLAQSLTDLHTHTGCQHTGNEGRDQGQGLRQGQGRQRRGGQQVAGDNLIRQVHDVFHQHGEGGRHKHGLEFHR